MDYVRLGTAGMKVSRICLGMMSYGTPGKGTQPWSLGLDDARPLFRRAVEGGVTFFDTADIYSVGVSEEITGTLMKEFMARDQAIIATKVMNALGPGPNDGGLSRKHIMDAIDASLRRLGTDYVDLYQIHRFDRNTPIEETMQALHDVVKAGKARYIGASSMYAYQFVQMQAAAERNSWTKFSSMQNLYNLAWREEERDMNAFCVETGVGIIPWSPLGGGFLAVDRRKVDKAATARLASPNAYSNKAYLLPQDFQVIDALAAVAARHGKPMAQVALAWLLTRPGVSAPIVGVTKMPQIEDALASTSLKLSAGDLDQLDKCYTWNRQLGLLR